MTVKSCYIFFMARRFRDRVEAGQLLAQSLQEYKGQKNVTVLALPRGGVPVGYQVAKALNLPLDIFLVRKLGVPGQEELAFGAIAAGGIIVHNEEIIQLLNLNPSSIEAVIAREKTVLDERNRKYRGDRPFPDLRNQTVILVDDGIATGATMRAAISALKDQCRKLAVAVPVGPPETITKLQKIADAVVCLETPAIFFAIGNWYEDFSQTSDEEVQQLLSKNL